MCWWFLNYYRNSKGSLEMSKMASLRKQIYQARLGGHVFLTMYSATPHFSLLFNKSIASLLSNLICLLDFHLRFHCNFIHCQMIVSHRRTLSKGHDHPSQVLERAHQSQNKYVFKGDETRARESSQEAAGNKTDDSWGVADKQWQWGRENGLEVT